MGKFVNMNIQNTVDKLTDGFKNMHNNPYYPLLDKGKTIVTYLSQSEELSTLDEGNLKAYSDRGKDSPIKFKKINNVILYGLEKLTLSMELGDFGLESGDIEGECTMLPGFVPKANDYFIINHYDNQYLFKVTKVEYGTPEVETVYSISYSYTRNNPDGVLDKIVGEYEMVINNIGTEYNAYIEKTDFDFLTAIDVLISKLIEYYIDLFFNTRVESFILQYNEQFVYDPALNEFLIRNKILSYDKNFSCYTQQMYLEPTFSLEYDKTFFRHIEDKDKNKLEDCYYNAYLDNINQINSILSMRQESYYRPHYIQKDEFVLACYTTIETIDVKLIEAIVDDEPLDMPDHLENIIINYMNNKTITKADIETLEEVVFSKNKRLYYLIPIVIYILNYNANKIVKMTKRRK
jgi:hypothetical protein